MPPKRYKTCYKYPNTSQSKTRGRKARPVAKACKRRTAGRAYNRWDKRTGRPALGKNKVVRATRPGARKGQY